MKILQYIFYGILVILIVILSAYILLFYYANSPIISNNFIKLDKIKYRIIGCGKSNEILYKSLYIEDFQKEKNDILFEILNDRKVINDSINIKPYLTTCDSLIAANNSINLEIYNKNVDNIDEVGSNHIVELIYIDTIGCHKGIFNNKCYKVNYVKISK